MPLFRRTALPHCSCRILRSLFAFKLLETKYSQHPAWLKVAVQGSRLHAEGYNCVCLQACDAMLPCRPR